MLRITRSSQFKKDVKRVRDKKILLDALQETINRLAQQQPLPERYQDHALIGGEYAGYRDCHVRPDLVLIYRLVGSEELYLLRVGSHSELRL